MTNEQIYPASAGHEYRKSDPNFLVLSDLSVGYRNRAVLNKLNLSAVRGELVAVIGRNGAGKSTLMRTIARLQPALSGKTLIAGKPLERYSRNELACLLSIVSTEPVAVSHMSVKQLVSFGRFPHSNWIGKLSERDLALIEESIRMVGIKSLENKKIHEISDGERQRAMIARTLAQDTDMILLDEPTAFLDMPNKYEVVRLLHRLTRERRKTILFSTHDLNIAMQEADKLWLMIDDTLYEGAPEDLVLNRQLARIFEGTKLHFDAGKGEFNIKRTDTRSINLSGKGQALFWTKKALERSGFSVNAKKNHHDPEVTVSESQPTYWTFQDQNEQMRFDSIYDLSQYVSNNGGH